MKKGMSFQIMVIVVLFAIILLISILFLSVGKDYIYDIQKKFFEFFGRKT